LNKFSFGEIENQVNIIKNYINDNYPEDKKKHGKHWTVDLARNVSYFTGESDVLIERM
jgi:hypothetical protein